MAKYVPVTKEELQLLVQDEAVYLIDIDVSLITDMSKLFYESTRKDFAGIETWDVSNVKDMRGMFNGAKTFNQDISNWDVSNVKDMSNMFEFTLFNQPIGSWDVSNVTDMSWMFAGAKNFNQPIGSWDVSKVIDMEWMFHGAEQFNQDISDWDISNVIEMSYMFDGARAFDLTYIQKWHLDDSSIACKMFGNQANQYGE